MDFFDYPKFKNNIEVSEDYQCAANEYFLLDSKNKRWDLKIIPPPDNKVVHLWCLVLKNPKLSGVARNFDWSLLKYYSDAKYENNQVIFKGTQLDCSNMYKKLWELGYQIQDDYILETYGNK